MAQEIEPSASLSQTFDRRSATVPQPARARLSLEKLPSGTIDMKPLLIGVVAWVALYGADQLLFSGHHVEPMMRMLRDISRGFGWS